MYGIFIYIWLIFMVNVGKYTVRPMDPMASFFFDNEELELEGRAAGVFVPLTRKNPLTPLIQWKVPPTGLLRFVEGKKNHCSRLG